MGRIMNAFALRTSSVTLSLLIYSAFYIVIFFPNAFFRHDDWLILGNSLLAADSGWRGFFSPTLVFDDLATPVTWFFRPMFKGAAYLFYRAFDLNYFRWLGCLLALQLGTLAITLRSLMILTRHRTTSVLFVYLYIGSIHLHLGSTIWIGEGLMNIPQMFFLSLTTLFYLRTLLNKHRYTPLESLIGVFCLLVALGFKESSLFHVVILVLLTALEPCFSKLALRSKCIHLSPYLLVCAIYFFVRVFMMPLNPAYSPGFSVNTWLRPLGIFGVSLGGIPLVAVSLLRLSSLSAYRALCAGLKKRFLYFLFLGISLTPYFGHSFFSPGWLYGPGYYLLFFLCLSHPPLSQVSPTFFLRVSLFLFLLTMIPISLELRKLGWWKWRVGQTQILEIVRSAKPDTSSLQIHKCRSEAFPASTLERVIGFKATFFHLWYTVHASTIQTEFLGCDDGVSTKADSLVLRWEFPRFTIGPHSAQ